MTIRFNDLLERAGLVCDDVLLVRHRPSEPSFSRTLRSAILTDPTLFDGYQASQGLHFAGWVRGVGHLAAFFEDGPGRAIFAGLYAVREVVEIGREAWEADPINRRLIAAGMHPWATREREMALRIGTNRIAALSDLIGRLLVEWRTRGQSWTHRADRHEMTVLAIHEENAFDPPPPPWQDWVVGWEELALLPPRRRQALAEWRGVYLICDARDGGRYVGSAGGADNLLGRWRDYGRTKDGGNLLLRDRDPATFRFSILQRLSPDLPSDEVVGIEAGWKRRLHTRHPLGLNAN